MPLKNPFTKKEELKGPEEKERIRKRRMSGEWWAQRFRCLSKKGLGPWGENFARLLEDPKHKESPLSPEEVKKESGRVRGPFPKGERARDIFAAVWNLSRFQLPPNEHLEMIYLLGDFRELKELIEYMGEIKGTREKSYSAEEIKEQIDKIRDKARRTGKITPGDLQSITRGQRSGFKEGGLRKVVKWLIAGELKEPKERE